MAPSNKSVLATAFTALTLFCVQGGSAQLLDESDGRVQRNLEVGTICVATAEPKQCFMRYGYTCVEHPAPQISVDAKELGCSMELSAGYLAHVNVLLDDGGWSVQMAHVAGQPAFRRSSSNAELQMHIRQLLNGYRPGSGGTGPGGVTARLGKRQGDDGTWEVRMVCAAFVDDDTPATALTNRVRSFCEEPMFEGVRALAQSAAQGPFRVAGPARYRWETWFDTIGSGREAVLVVGDYRFDAPHRPCRLQNNCCGGPAAQYLDSCRAVTEEELQQIEQCLPADTMEQQNAFRKCLQDASVPVGCVEQEDGWRLCH